MDVTQLEMFVAIVDTGSISAAARRIHRVPSNLTTRIQQLEASLGVQLFIREHQRLRLSPAGHDFLSYSRRILALIAEAKQAITGEEPSGTLRLGALESTAAVRIPAILAEFNQRYPRVQLDLTTGPSGEMIKRVLDGSLSAAFVDGPLSHPALGGIPVFDEEMMIVTPSSLAPVKRAQQVDGLPLYAFRNNCTYRHHFEAWFAADEAAPGRIYEMESYPSILACVAAGAGVAQMPRSMLEIMPGSSQVNAWPLSDAWRWITTWLVWRHDAQTRQLHAFTQVMPPPERPD